MKKLNVFGKRLLSVAKRLLSVAEVRLLNVAGVLLLATMMCVPFTASAQVTVGSGALPQATLDIVGAAGETGKAFRLDDGNQAPGKVLTCQDNAVGTWQLPGLHMIEENPFDEAYRIDSIPFAGTIRRVTGHSITLPPGKWKVEMEAVLSSTKNRPWATPIPEGNWVWIYFLLTDTPAAPVSTPDVDEGKRFVSMIYRALKGNATYNSIQYATTSGFWIVNNTGSTDKTYWVFVYMSMFSDQLPNSYLYSVLDTQYENKLVATPIL